jgi:dienelactone hydrolase
MSCPDCYNGSVHEGQPRGEVTHAYGLETYVVGPADGRPAKGIVVVLPDAFGWEFVNIRLLADSYADKGEFKVYAPDFMNGKRIFYVHGLVFRWSKANRCRSSGAIVLDGMHKSTKIARGDLFQDASTKPLYYRVNREIIMSVQLTLVSRYHGFRALRGMLPFIIYNWPSRAWPRVKGFFEQLRKEEGASLSVGAAGFCWGGKQVVLLGRGDTIDGRPLIDAGFTGHPSFLSLPSDIEKLELPVSFAMGDHDEQISVAKAESIKAIVEAKPESARGEAKIYSQAGHGFCVRADHDFPDSLKQADESTEQCIAWFNTHFKSSS